MTVGPLPLVQQHAPPLDSVVVESPLPGGIAAVVRFFFHVPQWIQIGGVVVGVLVALGAAVYLWRRRAAIVHWILTRSRGLKIAMALAVGVVALAAAGGGAVSWNYMQHDNGFCTGCHVMGPAFQRFTASEHDSLTCHDCHRQSMFASMRQLYLWVLERPEEIGAHAPVPNAVCEDCHVTGEPETWQRVASTAGHRTHLESDSSALRDVLCVTCHGLEVHRFAPVDSTCAQADCHVNTAIALGAMQNQTSLHCVTCHEFTAEVPAVATRDSAAGTLVPSMDQCFSCHEMQAILADFGPARDPHRATCGTCHNPHEQDSAAAAAETCASANCHVDWRDEPFHTGSRHVDVGTECTLCHEPHAARVDASDCQGCHAAIAARPDVPARMRQRLRQQAPFDTSAALRQRSSTGGVHPPLGAPPAAAGGDRLRGKGDLPPPSGTRGAVATKISPSPLPAPQDTFSHERHAELSCLTCHTTRSGHGGLTFEPPRGCQICHHQSPAASDCGTCHAAGELRAARAVTVTVAVEGAVPRDRPAEFLHEQHADQRCVECHAAPVSLAVREPVATCSDCHDGHHDAGRSCAACHLGVPADTIHGPPGSAHAACDACHVSSTVARLLPDRALCVTCHQESDHYPEKECTACHLQASPEEYRAHLTAPRAGP